MSNYFTCKQFKVYHHQSTMKVGTDALLLAALGNMPSHFSQVLEIGCGSGIISLAWKQRFLQSKVYAIDIHEASVYQAQHNFSISPWAPDLQAVVLSLQDLAAKAYQSGQSFDVILSNPPFFQNDLKSPDTKRNLARHNDSLPFVDLIDSINILLSAQGLCYLILPAEEAKIVMHLASQQSLFIHHIIYIYPGEDKPYNRLIIALSKEKKNLQEQHFYIRDKDGEYTKAYQEVMRPFLLYF